MGTNQKKQKKLKERRQMKENQAMSPGLRSEYALKTRQKNQGLNNPAPWGSNPAPGWKCSICGNTGLWTKGDCLKYCKRYF